MIAQGEARPLVCRRCSAPLAYAPGANRALGCRFCGEQNAIAHAPAPHARTASSYRELVDASFASHAQTTVQTVGCGSCGARTNRPSHVISGLCPFCDGATVSTGGATQQTVDGVLPFAFDEERARAAIANWERGLWLKPARLFGGPGSTPPMLNGILQDDAGSRRELWRAAGVLGLVMSIGPLLGSALLRADRMPVAMVVGFHVFGAAAVVAFVVSLRESVIQKRFLLGLDDPKPATTRR